MKVRPAATAVTGVLLIIIAGVTAIVAAPADSAPPPLRERVTVCRQAPHRIIAERPPCVWYAELQGNRTGNSLVVTANRKHPNRGAVIRQIDHDRARMLWVAAVIRTEVQGTLGGPLYDRVNICVDERGGSASSLPCIWHSPTMTDVAGGSHVVRRSGRQQPVTDAEGRRLLLVVAYRR